MLREAIESVLVQGIPEVEHIIVDGGSTDGTLDLLRQYPHLTVISEPDRGVYDALNKGLRRARGEIIGHLNSDDLYPPGTFSTVREAFSDSRVESVVGGCEIFEQHADGSQRLMHRFTEPDALDLTVENVTLGVPVTNARFFRRTLYDRVGYADLRYRIASDRDYLFRAALAKPITRILDQVVYRYRQHADSLTINSAASNEPKMREEYLAITEDWLTRENLPADARDVLLRWHRRESAKQAIHFAKCGDIAALKRTAMRGWTKNPGWLGECAQLAWRGLVARARN